MQIQVNTDNQTDGSAELTRQVEDVVENTLRRFSDRITRVEVHLADENSNTKSGNEDKRCVMEARPAGLQLITVSDIGSTMVQALHGAASKLAPSDVEMTPRVERLMPVTNPEYA